MKAFVYVAAVLLAAPCWAAERSTTNPIMGASKKGPEKAQVCSIDDPFGLAWSPVQANSARVQADLGCAMKADNVAGKLMQLQVVDTRRKTDFDAYRIDGSLNLAPSDVKTRPDLRERTVVLVGSGKADRDLYVACADLKQRGFQSVHVLRGGLRTWIAGGHPLVGQVTDDLSRLMPAELRREATFAHNLVLRTADVDAGRYELGHSVALKELTAAAVRSAIAAASKRRKGAPFASVVLVLGDRVDRSGLAPLLLAFQRDPLLVYGEPLADYAQFLEELKATWVAQARGPQVQACGL